MEKNKMMKLFHKNIRYLILLSFFNLLNNVSYSQNSVTISNGGYVSVDINPPFNPGSPIAIVSDNSKWLHYSIVLTPPEPTYSIAVAIASGIAPEGLVLYLEAAPYTGLEGGQPGTPTGRIVLSDQPQVLISNIGTCDTGSGIMVGHQLTYSFVITNPALLYASSPTIGLLFTITN